MEQAQLLILPSEVKVAILYSQLLLHPAEVRAQLNHYFNQVNQEALDQVALEMGLLAVLELQIKVILVVTVATAHRLWEEEEEEVHQLAEPAQHLLLQEMVATESHLLSQAQQ